MVRSGKKHLKTTIMGVKSPFVKVMACRGQVKFDRLNARINLPSTWERCCVSL